MIESLQLSLPVHCTLQAYPVGQSRVVWHELSPLQSMVQTLLVQSLH